MRVIGTAGHVDHGKSTLVRALTGINPDRLKEEQARQMTIDLGFAWMRMPKSKDVGIIDVPGHRDFIENMLAGVGGIDAAILVVAADEGVMPQTREHLAILDLLGVERGLVALTKIDLMDEEEWLGLVEEELRGLLEGSGLAGAPLVRVSAVSGAGLDELVASLDEILADIPDRADLGRPRMSIDRVFSMSGFGTVVTGTLIDGTLHVGEEIEVLPQAVRSRVRGLQSHKTKIDRATSGSRVAINISGVEVGEIERGDVAAMPGAYAPTRALDVNVRLLPDTGAPIKHNQQVKLFIGAAQRMARVRLLGTEALAPGSEGWLQLVVGKAVVASRGDRYILRRPSPGTTLGGGAVADAHPARLHRRMDANVPRRLERLLNGNPGEVLAETVAGLGVVEMGTAIKRAELATAETDAAIEKMMQSGEILAFREKGIGARTLVVERGVWEGIMAEIGSVVDDYHRSYPLREGLPREELKSKLRMEGRTFQEVLKEAGERGIFKVGGNWVARANFVPSLGPEEQKNVDALLKRFETGPYNPPSVKESQAAVGDEVVRHLLTSGILVQVGSDVVFESKAYEEMKRRIKGRLDGGETLSVAEVRDMFATSRKYALALMEHLDEIGLTIREGDVRRLSKSGRES